MSPFQCRLGVELIEGRIVPSSFGESHRRFDDHGPTTAAEIRTHDNESSGEQADRQTRTQVNTTSPLEQWRVSVSQSGTPSPQIRLTGQATGSQADGRNSATATTPAAIQPGVRAEQPPSVVGWRTTPGQRTRPAEPFVLMGVAVRGAGESNRPPASLWWADRPEATARPPATVPAQPDPPAEAVPAAPPGPTVAPGDLLPPLADLPGVAPVAGLLGVDVDAIDAGVRGLLDHAAALATGPADEDGAAGWWLWASTAAVVAGGAGYAVWSVKAARRPGRAIARTPWGDPHARRLG